MVECRLCLKIFSNGPALGGHVRSHYATLTLPLPPKTPQISELTTDSLTELSSTDCYEKPKKSMRLVDSVVVDSQINTEFESTRSRPKKKKAKRVSQLGVDGTMEAEDLAAMCLIMLSRGNESTRRVMRVYECEECGKVLKSSQGLGKHRHIHYKKKNMNNIISEDVKCIIDLNLPPPMEYEDDNNIINENLSKGNY